MPLHDRVDAEVQATRTTDAVTDKAFAVTIDAITNPYKSLWRGRKPCCCLPGIDHQSSLLVHFIVTSLADIPTTSIVTKEHTNAVGVFVLKIQLGILKC